MFIAKDVWVKADASADTARNEIAAAGFTAENAGVIKAPRIRECFAHYECVLDWVKPVEEKVKVNALVQGSVVHAPSTKNTLPMMCGNHTANERSCITSPSSTAIPREVAAAGEVFVVWKWMGWSSEHKREL